MTHNWTPTAYTMTGTCPAVDARAQVAAVVLPTVTLITKRGYARA